MSLIVNYGQDLTNKLGRYFFLKIMRQSIPCWYIFLITTGLFHFFSYPLHYPQSNTHTFCNLHIRASLVNANQHSMLFPNFWRSKLRHGAVFLTDASSWSRKLGNKRCFSKFKQLIWRLEPINDRLLRRHEVSVQFNQTVLSNLYKYVCVRMFMFSRFNQTHINMCAFARVYV